MKNENTDKNIIAEWDIINQHRLWTSTLQVPSPYMQDKSKATLKWYMSNMSFFYYKRKMAY